METDRGLLPVWGWGYKATCAAVWGSGVYCPQVGISLGLDSSDSLMWSMQQCEELCRMGVE